MLAVRRTGSPVAASNIFLASTATPKNIVQMIPAALYSHVELQ
jgi:hypothetical protein